jgi:hypothetical protein
MGKKIVFLNLADMDPHGLAPKTVAALGQKHHGSELIRSHDTNGNQIYCVDLFNLLKEDPQGSALPQIPAQELRQRAPFLMRTVFRELPKEKLKILQERIAVALLCREADKIMVGAHGRMGEPDKAYTGLGWDKGEGVLGTPEQFATLVASFLTTGQEYKIALIVCYGARSFDHRVNHEGDLREQDIKSSFAYRFFKTICTQYQVTLTARTGAVGFNETTGKSEVQTEAAITAEWDFRELESSKKTHDLEQKYNALSEKMVKTTSEGRRLLQIEAMAEEGKPEGLSSEEIEAYNTIRNYTQVIGRLQTLAFEKENRLNKYGKFVYTYDNGTLTVFRKYEAGAKVSRVLYTGPL